MLIIQPRSIDDNKIIGIINENRYVYLILNTKCSIVDYVMV